MKTYREWSQILPKDIREKMLRNVDKDLINQTFENLYMAICCGFDWGTSKEGYVFWMNISNQYE